MITHISASLREASQALENLRQNEAALAAIGNSAQALIDTFRNGNRAYSCGNGGSMTDAIHFAEELSGRYRRNRASLPALAISDIGHLTCTANDFGYEFVFSRFLEGHGRRGDCFVGISTSGRSKNVIRAAQVARELGMTVIAFTGQPGSELASLAHHEICTPAGAFADRVQELHIKVIHILLELVERELFPESYADAPD